MSPDEYEEERTYMIKNWDLVMKCQYVPLWKQKQQACDMK